jgi:hypothetical protein|tara:strand:+ start:366 stop:800 length:435 start_codon:yes stop_codon:yes gene_type:complete
MAYKGRYSPINKEKYQGNPTNVIYRSLWERKFMKWCDLSESVIKWGSEETVVPYVSPLDNKIHRYFIDFYVQLRDKDGILKSYLVEVKPKKYTKPPKTNPKRKTRAWFSEVKNWGVNEAKWKAAEEFAKDKNWQFIILTEDHLN